jgi:hypothetical protein
MRIEQQIEHNHGDEKQLHEQVDQLSRLLERALQGGLQVFGGAAERAQQRLALVVQPRLRLRGEAVVPGGIGGLPVGGGSAKLLLIAGQIAQEVPRFADERRQERDHHHPDQRQKAQRHGKAHDPAPRQRRNPARTPTRQPVHQRD